MELHSFLPLIHTLVYLVQMTESQFRVPEESNNRGCRALRGQFAHETFCHQYYNCWDGRATVEQCPGELLFSSVTSKCDYPEAVSCGIRIRNPAPFISGGRCLKEWGTFPDPVDCTAFYECAHGRAFRKVCPYYTAFDERYLVCVHAYEVECGGRGGIYGTLAPPIFPSIDSSGSSGQPSRPGASIGTSGSRRERQFEKAVSQEATFRCPHPRGLYANALDCRRFWLCREYRPALLKCPTGQLFDLPSLACTTPEKAQCGTAQNRIGRTQQLSASAEEVVPDRDEGPVYLADASSPNSRTTNKLNSNESPEITPGFSQDTSSSGSNRPAADATSAVIDSTSEKKQETDKEPGDENFTCPEPRGLYSYTTDCSKFWLCREYRPALLKCPSAQLFDSTSRVCTQPEKAQCPSQLNRT